MPKVKPGIIALSGKLGDDVIVASHKYGPHLRKAPKPGLRKNEPAFKKQHSRTAFINQLASELNTIVKNHSDNFKNPGFYRALQRRLRSEPINKRCLLLMKLKDLDVSSQYPLSRLSLPDMHVKGLKKSINITLTIRYHPEPGIHDGNCHYFEVLLITWDKSNRPAKYKRQYSDWINFNEGLPEFEFKFPCVTGTRHWIVCLRQRLGRNKKAIEAFAAEGMRIYEVGSLDKKEQKLMKNVKTAESSPTKTKRENENVTRVKARRVVPHP